MKMSRQDLEELQAAKGLLENPGFVAKITSAIGTPIEKGMDLLPAHWQGKIETVTQDALLYALKAALFTMKEGESKESYPWWHKVTATVTGTAGGVFGLPGLIVELPVSTVVMLRSIADIARANCEELSKMESRLTCLEVLAMGGPSKSDDATESGYFAVRVALAKAVTDASKYLAEKTVIEKSAPAMVRLIALIASRFQIQVTEKAAATLVPIIGGIGGGAINFLFMDHFQDMSRGHFTVRRLERKYGAELVRKQYDAIVLHPRAAEGQPA